MQSILKQDQTHLVPDCVRREAGLGAVLLLLVMMFIGRLTIRTPIAPEVLADRLFALLPISVTEWGVQAVGPWAKKIGFVMSVLLFATTGTFLNAGVVRLLGDLAERPIQIGVFLYAGLLWYATLSLGMPGFAMGVFTGVSYPMAIAAIVLLVMYQAHAVSLGFLLRWMSSRDRYRAQSARSGRRRMLAWLGVTALGSLIYTFLGRFSTVIRRGNPGRVSGGSGRFPDLEGLALEVTPTADFYHVSKNIVDPDLRADDWSLSLGGLVEHALKFDYWDVTAMEMKEQYATLMCISNPIGGDLIGTAMWKGVSFGRLLELAGVRSPAREVVLRAADGYSDSIPLDRALQDGTLLCYGMNGEALRPAHGFPVRLAVPGIYGMKNVKWLTGIELVDYDYKGYWQERGWDDLAGYKTMSRIDTPGNQISRGQTTIAGVAFAGDRGIHKVEVTSDGGRSWAIAELKTPPSPLSWTLWHLSWNPDRAGSFDLRVRATDGQGQTQISLPADPIPEGASGHHRRLVRVV
ncbi:MAG: molybdopterin-dependent oxidoreductase [Acidobacteria bacterium]|nr:molybdopterin-dependent oxidoreductase [Acidobacteriota bacterium]